MYSLAVVDPSREPLIASQPPPSRRCSEPDPNPHLIISIAAVLGLAVDDYETRSFAFGKGMGSVVRAASP